MGTRDAQRFSPWATILFPDLALATRSPSSLREQGAEKAHKKKGIFARTLAWCTRETLLSKWASEILSDFVCQFSVVNNTKPLGKRPAVLGVAGTPGKSPESMRLFLS